MNCFNTEGYWDAAIVKNYLGTLQTQHKENRCSYIFLCETFLISIFQYCSFWFSGYKKNEKRVMMVGCILKKVTKISATTTATK